KTAKTYNSGYSPVVTHLTTNPPVTSLSTAERTGSASFSNLWSYVEGLLFNLYHKGRHSPLHNYGAVLSSIKPLALHLHLERNTHTTLP
ncbi:hypothetical protein EK21DRAFT_64273, partial [Setomelanomma holmii]